jgi:monovalent cation:H+ antiporter-2, CPA2 family
MTESLIQQTIIILLASLLGAIVFSRLRMATIVAYISVGAVIGPFALEWVPDPQQFSLLAEFGVVFLLFSLGLEFSLNKMLAIRYTVFGVGAFQVIVCSAVFALSVYVWGTTFSVAILIAGALALSSTAIVTQELQNARQLHSVAGQVSVAVLLFQDLVAIVFLVLVPVLGASEDAQLASALAGAAINSAILITVLLAAGKWLLPLVYREVAKTGSEEIFVLSTLVILLLAAWITHLLHLSMALGGFIIGMMLSEGSFKYQIEGDIRPFRHILLGLFFVTIGMNLDLSLLLQHLPRIIVFTVCLMVIKTVVIALVVELAGYGSQDALTTGINLSQAGEFGLALIALAMLNEIIPPDQGSFIILIAIFSMVLSPPLIRKAGWISQRFRNQHPATKGISTRVIMPLADHVIIGGYGRLGTVLVEFLENNGIRYLAIDSNFELVERGRAAGKNIIYGNTDNIEILNRCHLSDARLIVLTFKSLEQGKAAVQGIRQHNADIPIVVRCQENAYFQELISVGANHVFPELLESSLLITRQVLEILGVEGNHIESQISNYRDS